MIIFPTDTNRIGGVMFSVLVGSNSGLLKLAFVASPLSTQH